VYRHIFPIWVVYVGLVGAGSLMPGDAAPTPDVSDKLLHAGAYLLMALSVPVRSASPRTWGLIALLATAYGASLELAQGALTATRSPEFLDALANGVGAAAGAGLRYALLLVKRDNST